MARAKKNCFWFQMSGTFGVPDRARVWILMRLWTINRDKPFWKWTIFASLELLHEQVSQGHGLVLSRGNRTCFLHTPLCAQGAKGTFSLLQGWEGVTQFGGLFFPQNISLTWATDKLLLPADTEPGFPLFIITLRAAQPNLRSGMKRGGCVVLCPKSILWGGRCVDVFFTNINSLRK